MLKNGINYLLLYYLIDTIEFQFMIIPYYSVKTPVSFLCRRSSNPKNDINLTCGQISIMYLFAIKLELGIMFNNKIENNKDLKKKKTKNKTKRTHTIYVYKICIMAKCGETI